MAPDFTRTSRITSMSSSMVLDINGWYCPASLADEVQTVSIYTLDTIRNSLWITCCSSLPFPLLEWTQETFDAGVLVTNARLEFEQAWTCGPWQHDLRQSGQQL